jgi:hypothetical protein
MPVQQMVDRRQRHATTQRSLQFGLDLRDYQDAAVAGTFEKRRQDFALAFDAQVLPPAPAATLALSITDRLPGEEPIAQAAGPHH